MPDELAKSKDQSSHALAEAALTLVPPHGRMNQEQWEIRAIAREYLAVHWPRYWFQLHRQFLQQQIIPQAARQFSPKMILHAGLLLPVTLGNPPLEIIWQLALRIADPDHEHAITVVVPTEDGGREAPTLGPASPDAPFNAVVIETTRPYLDALKPPPANFQQRLWAAVAFLWPATSLEELLDAMPLSGGAVVHRTGAVGVHPGATPKIRHFYDRLAVGYERRTQGLPWDGRIAAGPIPKTGANEIIDAITSILCDNQPATQDAVAELLGITHRRSLQKMVKRVTRGTNQTWKDLQEEGARRARGLGRLQREPQRVGLAQPKKAALGPP